MTLRRSILILAVTLCPLGATVEGGLLSPEAVMYGMSPAEAHRMMMFAAELRLEGGMGGSGEDGRRGRLPEHLRRTDFQTDLGGPAANAHSPHSGHSGSAGSTATDGPNGSSQSAIAGQLEITRAILVAYLWQESRLLIPTPFLDGVFRPPRTAS